MNANEVAKALTNILEGDKYSDYRDQIEAAVALGPAGRATLYEELGQIVKGQETEFYMVSYLLSMLDTDDKRTFEEWRRDEDIASIADNTPEQWD